MNFNNVKIIKKIGYGMFGTTYLVRIGKKKYAMKIQKILKSDIKRDFSKGIWREMDLYKYINKMPKESRSFFCNLHYFEISDNCNHTQERRWNPPVDSDLGKQVAELDASNYCIKYLLDYEGSITLNDYMEKKLSRRRIYSILLQICNITLLLYKGGYFHNDMQPGNIMVVPTKKKYFYLMGKKVPFYGRQLVAIDYGDVSHKKFGEGFTKNNGLAYLYYELSWNLFNVIFDGLKLEKDCRKKGEKLPYEKNSNFLDNFRKKLFIDHKKIVNKYAEKYLRVFPEAREMFMDVIKNIGKVEKMSDLTRGRDPDYYFRILLNKMEYNFAMDYPKEYMKLMGWCSLPRFRLPKKDVLEIMESKSYKKIIETIYKQSQE